MRFSTDLQIALSALIVSSCLALWSVATLIASENNSLLIPLKLAPGQHSYLLIHEQGCVGVAESYYNQGETTRLASQAVLSVMYNETPTQMLAQTNAEFAADGKLLSARLAIKVEQDTIDLLVRRRKLSSKLSLIVSLPGTSALEVPLGNDPFLKEGNNPALSYEYSSFFERAALSFSENLFSDKLPIRLVDNKKNLNACPQKSLYTIDVNDVIPNYKLLQKRLSKSKEKLNKA